MTLCGNAGWLCSAAPSVATGALSIYLLSQFETKDAGDFQFVSQHLWIKDFGISWHLGVDGISLFLVVLSGVLFPIALWGADGHKDYKAYTAWILLLEAGVIGTFLSLDLFLFFVMFEIVLVPPGGPRTKPKAANYALALARGELLVVYDAEDRPERDQLLKAAALFHAGPPRIACLQARLNFYNAHHNWLTRMFALDYALWFDVLLPGLEAIGAPMPLGGTSNHFRTDILRRIGGWDAFNVTEDADIGIRLAQLGFGVAMLDSTTFEEAPIALMPWLRQRSRWLKGHAQTWLVHMRDPAGLLRCAGLSGFLAFQLFLGGGVIFALVNPILWLAMLAGLQGADGNIAAAAMPGGSLAINNLVLTYLAVIGPRRRNWEELAPYGLTVIAYWAMVSAAGYRGLWQLMTRPFYWEKTPHGVTPG